MTAHTARRIKDWKGDREGEMGDGGGVLPRGSDIQSLIMKNCSLHMDAPIMPLGA